MTSIDVWDYAWAKSYVIGNLLFLASVGRPNNTSSNRRCKKSKNKIHRSAFRGVIVIDEGKKNLTWTVRGSGDRGACDSGYWRWIFRVATLSLRKFAGGYPARRGQQAQERPSTVHTIRRWFTNLHRRERYQKKSPLTNAPPRALQRDTCLVMLSNRN